MGKWEDWEANAAELSKRLRLDRHGNEGPLAQAQDMLPELGEMVRTVLLGAVYSRPGLDLKTRALCTVAALTVLGKEPLLRDWIGNAIAVGVKQVKAGKLEARFDPAVLFRELFDDGPPVAPERNQFVIHGQAIDHQSVPVRQEHLQDAVAVQVGHKRCL